MSKKQSKKSKLKDLYLDRPTSHGGWPDGHKGSFRDNKTPVHIQISKYLEDMGLLESSGNMLVSEKMLRSFIRKLFLHSSREKHE